MVKIEISTGNHCKSQEDWGNHEAFKPTPLKYYYITIVVIIIF